jgi:sulfatase modifying factor 1
MINQEAVNPMVLELPGSWRIWQRDGKEMVFVPQGEFLYGEEKKKLILPAYWIDKTPVTNAEFMQFVQATGYITTAERTGVGCANIHGKWEDIRGACWRYPGGDELGDIGNIEDHPVVQVSWGDAMAYARWANKRLPTEQEWEKAARGGDGRNYPWGEQKPTRRLCNFNLHEGRTTPVGKYSPQGDSPYGCVDMSGNVWEWTSSKGENGGKVLRGGGWSHPAENVRLVLRSIHKPEECYDTDGFRCVSER